MFFPLWKAFEKLPRSTANSAFGPTSTKTRFRPFSSVLIIFSACWDPDLNRQSLGFSMNPPEHSFVHACSTLCFSLFGKLPRSTANSVFAPTLTQTPSRPFSVTLIIFLACWDPELNRQSLGFSRNPPEPVMCTLVRPYVLLSFESYHEVRPIVPLRQLLLKHLPGRFLALQSYFRLAGNLN